MISKERMLIAMKNLFASNVTSSAKGAIWKKAGAE